MLNSYRLALHYKELGYSKGVAYILMCLLSPFKPKKIRKSLKYVYETSE